MWPLSKYFILLYSPSHVKKPTYGFSLVHLNGERHSLCALRPLSTATQAVRHSDGCSDNRSEYSGDAGQRDGAGLGHTSCYSERCTV